MPTDADERHQQASPRPSLRSSAVVEDNENSGSTCSTQIVSSCSHSSMPIRSENRTVRSYKKHSPMATSVVGTGQVTSTPGEPTRQALSKGKD